VGENCIRVRVLVPLALALAILLGSFIFSLDRHKRADIEAELASALDAVPNALEAKLEDRAHMMGAALQTLADNEQVKAAFRAADMPRLLALTKPLFEQLHSEHGITHFYFTDPQRINLLRVHKPEQAGDTIDRHTTVTAWASGEPSCGIELGPLGTLTLRVVMPWFDDQGLIGLVELGEEIDHIVPIVAQASDVDLCLIVSKEHLKEDAYRARQKFLGLPEEWGRFPHSLLLSGTLDEIPPSVSRHFPKEQHEHGAAQLRAKLADGRTLRGSFIPLLDARGVAIGDLVVMRDVTGQLASARASVLFNSVICLVVGAVLFASFYIYLGRVQRKLSERSASLSRANEQLTQEIAQRKRVAQRLKESEDRFRSLVEGTSDWIWEVDANGVYTYASPKVKDLLGYDPKEVIGKRPFDFMPPEEARRVAAEFRAVGEARAVLEKLENVNLHKDGRAVVLETSGVPVFDANGTFQGYRGIDRDISERKRAEEELALKNALLDAQREATIDGILVVESSGKMISFNRRFVEMWGIPEEVIASGSDERALQSVTEKLADPEAFLAGVHYLYAHPQEESRDEIALRDGRTFDRYSAPVVGRDRTYYGRVWYFRDITERKRAEEIIRRQAHYDALTELPNRVLFEDRLGVALAQARREGRMFGVLYLDLDRFKMVNDTLGHALGDQVLKDAGARLKSCLRASDTVCRLGGDEFAVLLPDIGDPRDAARVAGKIIVAFRRPFHLEGHEMYISTSIGISIYPSDGREAKVLLQKGDAALYEAKQQGRNRFLFHTSRLEGRAQQRLALENELRRAIDGRQLILHYQPEVEIDTGRIISLEALLRWQHPKRGILAAAEFIEVAEEAGLMESIGEWVLREACAQARAWQEEEACDPGLRVAVNLSGREFHTENLANRVRAILAAAGLGPESLELEISERAVMLNVEASVAAMQELKEQGVYLALDDFGLGHSPLIHMKLFPIDTLKIDRSFIRDVTSDANDQAIVEAILAMARALDLRIIAEGVETEEQLAFLRARGCYGMQGYLHNSPLTAEAVCELLRAERAATRNKLSSPTPG